jgi:hypothetical protein
MLKKMNSIKLKQRGLVSLFGITAFAVVTGALVVGGQFLYQSNNKLNNTFEQAEYSERSTQLLISYASLEGRLPCPATSRGGTEDCQKTDFKGWLPVETLNKSIGPFSKEETLKLDNIRYMVNRDLRESSSSKNNRDLAAVADVYQPYINAKSVSKVQSLNDWCYKIDPLSIVNESNNFLSPALDPIIENSSDINLNDSSSSVKFAFATIVAGQSNFDSVNSSNQLVVRSPIKKRDENYDDMVRIINKGYLSGFFQCGAILQSMEQLQTGAKWTQRNWDERAALVASYEEKITESIPKEIADNAIDLIFYLAQTIASTSDTPTSLFRLITDARKCLTGDMSACPTLPTEPFLLPPKLATMITDIIAEVTRIATNVFPFIRLAWYGVNADYLKGKVLWDERVFLIDSADKLGPLLQQRQSN